jgi:hypothetical protein
MRRIVDEANEAITALDRELARMDDRLSWLDSSPAQITANQNDYPTGDFTVLRLDADVNRNITGFVAGIRGAILVVINVGAGGAGVDDIVLTNEDVLSVAANRISTQAGANITLTNVGAAGRSVAVLWYDTTSSRWKEIA